MPNNNFTFWDRLKLGFQLGGTPNTPGFGIPYSPKGWNVADKFDQPEGESGFYNDGKTEILDAVNVFADRAKAPFDYLKTILILVAVIMVANLFKK